jgi:hypothetical protein
MWPSLRPVTAGLLLDLRLILISRQPRRGDYRSVEPHPAFLSRPGLMAAREIPFLADRG